MNYILYNEKCGESRSDPIFQNRVQKKIEEKIGKGDFVSLIDFDCSFFFKHLFPSDSVVVVGGDGTLHWFINSVDIDRFPCSLYLCPGGSGDDFYRDITGKEYSHFDLVKINKYITDLPRAEINGEIYRFINGIGFGIDGETCAKAEELKKKGKAKINYSRITLRLILGRFLRPKADIVIDGEKRSFNNVYLVSSMKGRYYGGGVMISPGQDRQTGYLTLIVASDKGRLSALYNFMKVIKGKHLSEDNSGLCKVFICSGIDVVFSSPCALEIDGEVIRDVTSYKVRT